MHGVHDDVLYSPLSAPDIFRRACFLTVWMREMFDVERCGIWDGGRVAPRDGNTTSLFVNEKTKKKNLLVFGTGFVAICHDFCF